MRFLKIFDRTPDRANPAEELFLFVHLPKTGGQTLRNCFIKHMAFHREFIHLGPYGEENAAKLGLRPFHERPPEERALARVILGHYVNHQTHLLVPGKIPRYAVFLREPAELLVSLYNFEMRYHHPPGQPAPPFDEWYNKTNRRHLITQWFLFHFLQNRKPTPDRSALREINATLDRFWFVGCSEHLDRDAPVLLQRMGIPPDLERANVGGVHYPKLVSLDDGLRKKLRAENELDYELYEFWRARLDKSIARVRGERVAQGQ